VEGTVASGFGGRGGRHHDGFDILAREGTEVFAAGDGTVAYAGDSLRGYGNALVLDHGAGVTTLYGHLRGIRVKSGDVVPRGTVIGTVGKTGNATTSHLHFEVRVSGRSVDPGIYFPRKDAPK
jgi:murein DD-endopeptidase MepM/ murein hydrolase activator NlpD